MTFWKLSLASLVVLAAACAPEGAETPAPGPVAEATPAPGPGEPTLDEVRAASERFRDVNVAIAEGYMRDPTDTCEMAVNMGRPPEDGGMGIHYLRPDLLGLNTPPDQRPNGDGVHTDFRVPAVLLYEPQADGSLELVAVENLIFEDGWKASGATGVPTFHGVPWDYMADDPTTPLDEAHGFAPHYDRHVWVYRENPNGVFTPFNPAVTCEHHAGGTGHGPSH